VIDLSNDGAVVGRQRPPAGDRRVPVRALGSVPAAVEVLEGRVVRRDEAGPAPPSMLMLQIVIRCSMLSARMASPRYSNTWPVPPPTPIRAMSARMMSFALTPAPRRPSTRTSYVFGSRWSSVWVARTISTSLVPIPNASAPNAPWVAVWESPHTIVMPGCVSPSSGPMTWTIPWVSAP
jgi:hypothetical protein